MTLSSYYFINQAKEFFMFAGLLCLDLFLFVYLSYKFKYMEYKTQEGNLKKPNR